MRQVEEKGEQENKWCEVNECNTSSKKEEGRRGEGGGSDGKDNV